jgi:murein DD-endopeptidase MepM/ murein hydrolase activator NlpD
MQKVEIILLPFATKRLPRYLKLSKATIFALIFTFLSMLVLMAYFLLGQATQVYHQWVYASLDREHRVLLEKLITVKEKIIQADKILSSKDQTLKDISLITETMPSKKQISSVLNQTVAPWDEKGFTSPDYFMTREFTLDGIEKAAISKANTIWDVISRLEERLDFHSNWVTKCYHDMENKYSKWARIPSALPVNGIITCGYGARHSPFGGPLIEAHHGVDLAGPIGLPLKATADGVILLAQWMSGYGNLVIIDHENGLYSYYGHCSLLKVVEGQKVKRYQTIALLGNTGRSTGPHVHFEIREDEKSVDPLNFIAVEEVH